MPKALVRSVMMLLVLFAVVFSLAAGAESAEKNFRFPNGIYFSYPSEYQVFSQSKLDGLGYVVRLKKVSDDTVTMMFSVTLLENWVEGFDITDLGLLKEVLKDMPMPYQPPQLRRTKITVAGKEASLIEISMSEDGIDTFQRMVSVRSSNNVVTVYSIASDKGKFDECRVIGEKIENSLNFRRVRRNCCKQ